MSIRIITDSTTDFTSAEAQQLDVSIVPMRTIFGKTEYLDGIDLTHEQFYTMLEQSDELPTTSQPIPHDFEQVIRQAQEAGEASIIITIAEKLSGTYQSAELAKKACGGKDIWVIDSETATLAHRALVERAIELRDQGTPAEEIVHILEKEKKSIRLFAMVDTLEYLHKGGRLSRTSAIAGTLMKVKPLITIRQGEIIPVGKARGSSKAYGELFALTEKEGGIDFDKPFALGYTGNRERLDQFEALFHERYKGRTPLVGSIGSAIGTHVGPGAVGLFFFAREDN